MPRLLTRVRRIGFDGFQRSVDSSAGAEGSGDATGGVRPPGRRPVPRCVIAGVDQLAARGALRRRILVVVALVSESGVVEALRTRRGFPDAGKKGIRVLASTIARSHLQSMDVDPVASSRRTASTAIARGMPCQRRELAVRAATSCSARAAQGVQTATMSRNTMVRCGSC